MLDRSVKVRLSAEEYHQLQQIMGAERRSAAAVLRVALAHYAGAFHPSAAVKLPAGHPDPRD